MSNEKELVAVELSMKELEYVIQALFDQEEGVSALSDKLMDVYDTFVEGDN